MSYELSRQGFGLELRKRKGDFNDRNNSSFWEFVFTRKLNELLIGNYSAGDAPLANDLINRLDEQARVI
jgi:hypothetical protein